MYSSSTATLAKCAANKVPEKEVAVGQNFRPMELMRYRRLAGSPLCYSLETSEDEKT